MVFTSQITSDAVWVIQAKDLLHYTSISFWTCHDIFCSLIIIKSHCATGEYLYLCAYSNILAELQLSEAKWSYSCSFTTDLTKIYYEYLLFLLPKALKCVLASLSHTCQFKDFTH